MHHSPIPPEITLDANHCALVRALDGDVQTVFAGVAEVVIASKSTQANVRLLLGLFAGVVVVACAAFAWLFTHQQETDRRATDIAGREARMAVYEQDRHFEDKATEIAQRAVRLDREDRAREMMRVTAQAPH